MGSRPPGRGKIPFLLLVLWLLSGHAVADEVLVINSGRGAPFATPQQDGFYDRLVVELFSRLGLRATTIKLPSERALINANSGIDDGNLARIRGLEKKYPNLVRVPEKIVSFEFLVFTNGLEFPVQGWESLAPYNIAYITGWKILENRAQYYRSVTRARDGPQLFGLLEAGRVDLVLYERWSGLWRMKQYPGRLRYLEPPLERRDLFLYVNRRHADRVAALTAALREMKRDGTYQQIFDETLGVLLRPGNGPDGSG